MDGAYRGTAASSAASTTFAFTPSANFAVGSAAVLALATDNSVGIGLDPFVGVTDSLGNLWTTRAQRLNDEFGFGFPNAGVAFRLLSCAQNVAPLTAATVITVALAASTENKVASLVEVTGAGAFVAAGTEAGFGSIATVLSSSITAGNVIVGAAGCRIGASPSPWVSDMDTLRGAWVAQQTTASTHQAVTAQYKVVTADGPQNYDPEIVPVFAIWASGWVEFAPAVVVPPEPTVASRFRVDIRLRHPSAGIRI